MEKFISILEIKTYCDKNSVEYFLDEPMSKHTSFKIGGTCYMFIVPSSTDHISDIIKIANRSNIKYMTLGKGSNVLFSDTGYDGVIINIGHNLYDIKLVDDTKIYCSAGISLDKLCLYAMENSLTGLEFGYGIPGSVGGAVYMNAGAYGGEIRDVVESVDYIDDKGNLLSCSGDDLDLSYRHSFFTDKQYCIVGCTINLSLGEKSIISDKMDDLMERRRSKQPLEYPSAGSTFKRPVGSYASALIDQCGLKGLRVGGAMVSEKHAGFVINYDNATCDDVVTLVGKVQDIVRQETGFELECEVKVLK